MLPRLRHLGPALAAALLASLLLALTPVLCLGGVVRHRCHCAEALGDGHCCKDEGAAAGCDCGGECSHDDCDDDPCRAEVLVRIEDAGAGPESSAIGSIDFGAALLAVGISPLPPLDARHGRPAPRSRDASNLPYPPADRPLRC